MAIQNRRGSYDNFDTGKLLPGEWAVVTTGDQNSTDGTAVYMCFKAGVVKRMATYEDMLENINSSVGEVVENALGTAISDCEQAKEEAISAASNANLSAEAANEAYENYEKNNAATATKLLNGSQIDGVKFQGDAPIHHFAICETAESDPVKRVTVSGFYLTNGARVLAKFINGVSSGENYLAVSEWTQKPILYNGSTDIPATPPGSVIELTYDGENWNMVGIIGAGTFFGVCETAVASQEKTVDIQGFALSEGISVIVKFVNQNANLSPTLNVSNTGAKPIHYKGVAFSSISAGIVLELTYDGESWNIVGEMNEKQKWVPTYIFDGEAISEQQYILINSMYNFDLVEFIGFGTTSGFDELYPFSIRTEPSKIIDQEFSLSFLKGTMIGNIGISVTGSASSFKITSNQTTSNGNAVPELAGKITKIIGYK